MSKTGSAMNQDLIELYFIEKYNWLPYQVDKIPYKWIQKYFLIEKYKQAGVESKRQVEEFQAEFTKKPKKRR